MINSNKITPLISVIVPIYNSEKFLSECLQSIQKQTLSNIEIICVNDGSTDRSREIINEFSQKDSRFVLVETFHIGPTNARKYAMNLATGEYIGFVDSDDYITNDYFEKLYKSIYEADAEIAIATRQLRFSDREKNYFYCGNEIYDNNFTTQDRSSFLVSGIMWNKIYKRNFALYISNKFYHNTCLVCEDNSFTIFAILLAKKNRNDQYCMLFL